jgi:xanthine dehydrogenase accessory factor
MTLDILGLARETAEREPCVLATVVWRRGPSSGAVGGKALIGADGSVRGWLGGACAEPAVLREAMAALREGTPRLMFLGPADELEERRREGMVSVPIACQSEGALEVYLEPIGPAPHLLAVGRSPAASTLVRLASALGWRGALVEGPELAAAAPSERSFVVVATQGHDDEAALEGALAVRPAYLGLVASRRRAEAVLGYLRQRGAAEADLARVRSPAGLDLGRVAPDEIAVAILAEIVALRASGELASGVAAAAGPRLDAVIDPVCGMTVDLATARHRLERDGGTVAFCSAGCLAAYESDPARSSASA